VKKKVVTKDAKGITADFIDHIDDELEAIWSSISLMGYAGQQSNHHIETEVALLSEDLGKRIISLKDFIHQHVDPD